MRGFWRAFVWLRWWNVLCERFLIFSSLWTLFSSSTGFWVRPFWRLIQNLVQWGGNNVFWRADFWDLDFLCLWNKLESVNNVGVLNQNNFWRLIENAGLWCWFWFGFSNWVLSDFSLVLLTLIFTFFFFFSFFFEAFSSKGFRDCVVQGRVFLTHFCLLRWRNDLCERCLIFSSLWTLFAFFFFRRLVLSQTVWTSDSTPGAKKRKQCFLKSWFLRWWSSCLWNKLEWMWLVWLAFWIKTFLTFDWKRRLPLFTLIWFLKFLLLNHICSFFSVDVLGKKKKNEIPFSHSVSGRGFWRAFVERIWWNFLCERYLIFSSLWTLFSFLDFWFWVRPFWRLIQHLVRRSENSVFWRADCWGDDLLVCGLSWSVCLPSLGVLNQNIFDVWLKKPDRGVDSDLVFTNSCVWIDFSLDSFFWRFLGEKREIPFSHSVSGREFWRTFVRFWWNVLSERCLIFSSLWTLFCFFAFGFWVRPFLTPGAKRRKQRYLKSWFLRCCFERKKKSSSSTMFQGKNSYLVLLDICDVMFCAKDVWFSALCERCFCFRYGFESDRLDVWFNTWLSQKHRFWRPGFWIVDFFLFV